jgi:hypothetical protein
MNPVGRKRLPVVILVNTATIYTVTASAIFLPDFASGNEVTMVEVHDEVGAEQSECFVSNDGRSTCMYT